MSASSSNNDFPNRELTNESTKELSNVLKRVLLEMLSQSCPCHYPRFRYLIRFDHHNYKAGPVLCVDTNYIVSISCHKELNFLTLTSRITENVIGDYSEDLIYTCQKCGTVYKWIGIQYSINFEFEYFDILETKYVSDIGAPVSFPFPLFQGLFGFEVSEILKCSKEFELGDTNKVFNYLTQKSK